MLIQDKKGPKNQLVDKIVSHCWKPFLIPEASGQSLADFSGCASVFFCSCKQAVLGQPQSPALDGAGTAFYLLLLIWIILLQTVQNKGPVLKGGSVAFVGSSGWVCTLIPQVTSC